MKKSLKIGVQFLMHPGGILKANLTSKTLPKSLPNRPKIDEKWTSKSIKILDAFWMAFWWFLEPTRSLWPPFWGPKMGGQGGSTKGPEITFRGPFGYFLALGAVLEPGWLQDGPQVQFWSIFLWILDNFSTIFGRFWSDFGMIFARFLMDVLLATGQFWCCLVIASHLQTHNQTSIHPYIPRPGGGLAVGNWIL